jgi:hypothetical protein
MKAANPGIDKKTLRMIEKLKKQFLKCTGKDISKDCLLRIFIDAIRSKYDYKALERFAKAVDESGVLDKL